MRWLLDPDSGFNRFLTRTFDMLLLSVLTFVCCLPIITIGAAVSALYDVTIRIVLNKDHTILKEYFKAFGRNFKKGTLIWLICVAGIAFVAANFYLMSVVVDIDQTIRMVIFIIMIIVTVLFAFVLIYVFPLQARFENSVMTTIKNALFISIVQCPRSIGLLFMNVVVVILGIISPSVVPMLILVEFSLVAYITARTMVKIFGILGDAEARGEYVPKEEDEPESSEETKEEEQAEEETPQNE